MKIFFRRIHLYLGFAAGIVIMITCFTGGLLVFEDELQHLFYKERYFVQASVQSSVPARPIEAMIKSLEQKVPGSHINGIKIYTDSSRSAEISYTPKREEVKKRKTAALLKKQDAKPASAPKENNRFIAYVNPYSAEIIELYNYRDTFFFSMMSLHRWLLGGETGKLIVGICTLLFLFILITGIILWWPKSNNIIKQRLTVKWESGWKRLNHDLHIVLGFYSAIFLFIFAFTGLAWSFSWFNKGIYAVTNSTIAQLKPPVCAFQPANKKLSCDDILSFIKTKIPPVKYYNITPPKDSLAPYAVSVLTNDAPHESATDLYYLHKYESSIIQTQKFIDRNLGQRIRSAFKPVHVASIWGPTSKIIGLIVCLLGVIFPATGYMMWWLRTSKKIKE